MATKRQIFGKVWSSGRSYLESVILDCILIRTNWLLLSQLLPSTQPVRQRRVVENSSNCCQCNILNVTRPFVKPLIKHRGSKIVAEYTNKGLNIFIHLFEGFVSWIQICVSILNHVRFNDQALSCAISSFPKRRNKMWNNFVLKSVTVGRYFFR